MIEDDRTAEGAAADRPAPPFLVLRPGISFWLEREGHTAMRATLQALEEGCFHEAQCIDRSGGLWPILSAAADRSALIDRPVPWKRVPVSVELGPRRVVRLSDVVESLRRVLEGPTDFLDHLGTEPSRLSDRLGACASIADVIDVIDQLGA